MKNKIIKGFWALVIGGVFGLTSCSDMLSIHPNDYLDTEGHQLNMPNDTLYSVTGILKQFQQLGEKYVVLGDLRGDLMDVTENADINLQEIANFKFDPANKNPYVSARDYYAVINNCNYYLQRVDTSVVSGGRKVFMGEYAAVKAIRDWTYMQLALNYGKAPYITKPVLNIADMNSNYEVLPWPELIKRLLEADLPDLMNESIYPTYGGGLQRNAFVSGPNVAGDMLLWLGAYTGETQYYEIAAMIYYRYIVDATFGSSNLASNMLYFRGGGNFNNSWYNTNFDEIGTNMWSFVISGESFSNFYYPMKSSETTTYPPLFNLFLPIISTPNYNFKYMLQPSEAAMNLWKNENYVYYDGTNRLVLYTKGDLRGFPQDKYSSYPSCGSYYYADYLDQTKTIPCISKYAYALVRGSSYNGPYYQSFSSSSSGSSSSASWSSFSSSSDPNPSIVPIYRVGKLYLRFAEALNAMGKPSVAFAVLKYGLKSTTLRDTTIISQDEITPLPPYCDFTDYAFNNQTGMHSRGTGDITYDTLYHATSLYAINDETLNNNRELGYYGFPDTLASKMDSMKFVDVLISKELALETAYEGNRYPDLMRFAYRRKNPDWGGDNNFLPEWVGRRNDVLKVLLMDETKWFLPMQE